MFNYIKWVAVHSVLVENTTDLKIHVDPGVITRSQNVLSVSGNLATHTHTHSLTHTRRMFIFTARLCPTSQLESQEADGSSAPSCPTHRSHNPDESEKKTPPRLEIEENTHKNRLYYSTVLCSVT